MIAPATFLWKQETSTEESMDVDELSKNGQLWVWIHPSAFDQAHESIKKTLADLKLSDDVGIKDLENSLVIFDFTGPRSTALLQAVLHLCTSDNINMEAHKVAVSAKAHVLIFFLMYTLLTVNSWENNIGLGDNLTFAHIVVSSSWSGAQSFG